jgi:hypothetical protein
MQKSKDIFQVVVFLMIIVGGIYGVFFWWPAHLRAVHLAEGWVDPKGWDCPYDHPIKANLKSMIYHMPSDQYWDRTNAMNGRCFDYSWNAEEQGFRAIMGGR